jgi:hypothetical protein
MSLRSSPKKIKPVLSEEGEVPDWVYAEWYDMREEELNAQAEWQLSQAFRLRDRGNDPEDEGGKAMNLLSQIQTLILKAHTDEWGTVSRTIIHPLVQSLDKCIRKKRAALKMISMRMAEDLGVPLEPEDFK